MYDPGNIGQNRNSKEKLHLCGCINITFVSVFIKIAKVLKSKIVAEDNSMNTYQTNVQWKLVLT